MSAMRRPLLALLLAAAIPATAEAAPRYAPQGLAESVTTAHFVVHYTADRSTDHAITPAAAQRVAANAERVWSVIVDGWAYPAPLADADGHVDIDVFRFANGNAGDAYPLDTHRRAWRFPGRIELDVRYATNVDVLGHEFFHVVQFGMFGRNANWLDESTARWSEHEANWPGGWPEVLDAGYLAHPDMSLDCTEKSCPAGTWDGGYERWLFWSFLSARYGRTLVRDFYASEPSWASALPLNQPFSSTASLDAFLRTRGSSLAKEFGDFAIANAAGSYAAVTAGGRVAAKRIVLGMPTSVTVDHLAAQYLELGRSKPCRVVPLHVDVTAPATSDRPYLVFGAVAAPLTTSVTIAWKTCSARTLIVVANGALAGDGVTYTVTASRRLSRAWG
jgi:hypothetical protein